MPVQSSDLDNWFSYHAPVGDQAERYGKIRDAAYAFAETILRNTPNCADQTAAFRMLRETVMMANAAIACNEVVSEGRLL